MEAIAKKIRGLQKRIRAIESLKTRDKDPLTMAQKIKMSRENALRKELAHFEALSSNGSAGPRQNVEKSKKSTDSVGTKTTATQINRIENDKCDENMKPLKSTSATAAWWRGTSTIRNLDKSAAKDDKDNNARKGARESSKQKLKCRFRTSAREFVPSFALMSNTISERTDVADDETSTSTLSPLSSSVSKGDEIASPEAIPKCLSPPTIKTSNIGAALKGNTNIKSCADNTKKSPNASRIRSIRKKLRDIKKLDNKIQTGTLKKISEAQRLKLRKRFDLERELRNLEISDGCAEIAVNHLQEREACGYREDASHVPESSDSPMKSSFAIGRQLSEQGMSSEDFQRLCCLGTGSFGKVLQVRHNESGNVYAMKIIKKSKVVKKKVELSTMLERDVLAQVAHPFIVELHCAFQTIDKLYLVMTFISGGELFWHLHDQGTFPEHIARFYVAELVLAVSYLHSKNIIHRDIRPENLLLGGDGHLIVTDFGLAKALSRSRNERVNQFDESYLAIREEKRREIDLDAASVTSSPRHIAATTNEREKESDGSSLDVYSGGATEILPSPPPPSSPPLAKATRAMTLCGAEEYMAPEMIAGGGYGKSVDWWAVGILLYEMLTGSPPFTQKGRSGSCKKIFHMILNERVKMPPYLSKPCHAVMRGFLERNVQRRLGCFKSTMFKKGGVDAIKVHPFFAKTRWEKLTSKGVKPPIIPDLADVADTRHFTEDFLSMPPRDTPRLVAKKAPKDTPTSPFRLSDDKFDPSVTVSPFRGFSYVYEEPPSKSAGTTQIETRLPSVDTEAVAEADRDTGGSG